MLQHIWGRRCTWAIATVLALGSAMACGDDESDNDNPDASTGSGGKGGAGGKGGSGGKGGAGGKGGSGGADEDAGPPSEALKGTGADCHSYTEMMGDKCQGWYCGVTEAELAAAVNPKARCGGDVGLLCKGTVTTRVGECAREKKLANLDKSNEELRPLVRDCAYEDEQIREKVPEDCLDCIIDVADCAGAVDNCLASCLSGDSPGCDACRLSKNCDPQVFVCGQLPSPLE
jgi:hypothetical protein